MELNLASDWKGYLADELAAPYFLELMDFVEQAYEEQVCYPPKSSIFAAFESCKWDQLKVVIIGQDPYHGAGQANGLCFSVHEGITFPPSLINIFKEIKSDLGLEIPESGDLFRWAEQGVLLLNATLTVQESQAGSHQGKGWERFTDAVIRKISAEKSDVVFLLWGGFARGKAKLIDKKKHVILESGHPSPLSANRGYWFGNQNFSKCNEALVSKGMTPIQW